MARHLRRLRKSKTVKRSSNQPKAKTKSKTKRKKKKKR